MKFIKKIIKVLLSIFIKPKLYFILGEGSKLYSEGSINNMVKDKNLVIIGKDTHIRGQLQVMEFGAMLKIGNDCYIGHNTCIWAFKNIVIGDRVLISHNCNIFDSNTHPIDPKERHKHFKQIIEKGFPTSFYCDEEEVIIEDDVWIGANSLILKGVKIGHGSIVGASSVVTQDVAPYSIVAGNPARVVKKIFGDHD